VGNFPPGWSEWNDRFRDTVRRYWRGDNHTIGELASRLSGSSDLFEKQGRRPWASLNFVTAHDGFTLSDLVTYNQKHNEANGEDNRDGTDNNHSWNCGVEGPTDDASIRELREQQKRNLLATLLLAQGVPMLVAGDEFGRTQHGNNNAYCQDNEIGWVNWQEVSETDRALTEFVRSVLRLRRDHPTFRRTRFLTGTAVYENGPRDVTWLIPEGHEMTPQDWSRPFTRCLGMELYRAGPTDEGRDDEHFLLVVNAHGGEMRFTLPEARLSGAWQIEFDTARADGTDETRLWRGGETYPLHQRSFVLLRDS
jgi:glycogen operon protein